MIDTPTLNWIVNLLAADIGKVVAGILVLASILEMLVRFKEWLSWKL